MANLVDMPIRRCRPSEDIVPFSECRSNLSAYISRTRETRRPILITQNGRAASYLVDADSLDAMMDCLELSKDIEISRQEIAAGKGIPHEQVIQESLEMLSKRFSKKKATI